MTKKFLQIFSLLAIMLMVGVNNAWATDYTELFTISSGNVVSSSSYTTYEATVDKRDWIITFGGNNKSVGVNKDNRAKCVIGATYAKYAVSPVTTSDIASAFASKTSISNVSKISYTFNGGNNQDNTNVYLIYSSDGNTFSQVTLTKGAQGAAISSETEYEFAECSGFFALLFVATNTSGAWRIDDVDITFYQVKSDGPTVAVPTFSPEDGTEFFTSLNVTITPSTGNTVYYTTDGSNPKESSTNSDSEVVLPLSVTTTVKAACKDGSGNWSSIVDATFTKVDRSYAWDLSKDQTTSASTSQLSWGNAIATVQVDKNTCNTNTNNYYPGTSGKSYTSTRFYQNSKLTISPESGVTITKVEFTAASETYATTFAGSSWTNALASASTTLVTVTPTDGTSDIQATIGGTCGFTEIKLYYTGVEPATLPISSANWATFIAPFACDLDGTGVTAYTISADLNTFTPVNPIPANTPVVAYKTSADDITFYGVSTATQDSYTEGALVGVLTATADIPATTATNTNFVLQNGGSGVGFYKVNGTASLKANRAYLTVPTSSLSAKDIIELPADGATGIISILNPTKAEKAGIYDLYGRQLSAPQKGINIINGVKVLVK